jgi:protein-disulfide isomerase
MRNRGRGAKRATRVSPRDHAQGSPLAKVTLIGYGDFASPDCAQAYRDVKKIQRKMGSRLFYVFRSFPQPEEYEHSEDAAEAAECAEAQGKFWEMHDRIFDNEGASDALQLSRYAADLGMDLIRFRREMRDHVHLPGIRAGQRRGIRCGVAAAPAFFVNLVRHESAFGLATLLPAVQAAAGG